MGNRFITLIIVLFTVTALPSIAVSDDPIRVDSAGKVGISNNSPAEALDVNGKIKATTGGMSTLLDGNTLTFNRPGDSYFHQSGGTGAGFRFQLNAADALIIRSDRFFIYRPLMAGPDSQVDDCGDGIVSSGQYLQCSSSSIRYKENIGEYTDGIEKVMQLRPVSFEWRDKEHRGAQRKVGLIAEEVAQVAPELVFYNNGQVEGVVHNSLTVMLLNAVQQLNARVVALEQERER